MKNRIRRQRTTALVALLAGTLALNACGTKVAADEADRVPAHTVQVSEPATGGGGGSGSRISSFE